MPEVTPVWFNSENDALFGQDVRTEGGGLYRLPSETTPTGACRARRASQSPGNGSVLAKSSPSLPAAGRMTHSFPPLWPRLPAVRPESLMWHIMENKSYLLLLLTGLLTSVLKRKRSLGPLEDKAYFRSTLDVLFGNPPSPPPQEWHSKMEWQTSFGIGFSISLPARWKEKAYCCLALLK